MKPIPLKALSGLLALVLAVVACGAPGQATTVPATEGPPTATLVSGPCTLFADDNVTVYERPSVASGVFGTMSAGMSEPVEAKTADGWYGFEPGVAQAANIGIFRLRWVQEGTSGLRIEGDCAAVPVVVGPPAGVCFFMPMDTTSVYQLPDLASPIVATLHVEDYAAVIGRTTGWGQVDLGQGNTGLAVVGWVQESALNVNGPCDSLPTVSPAEAAGATPTPTPVPGPAMLTPRSGDLLCSFGPGIEYAPGGTLLSGAVVPILGRNPSSDWWAFDLPGHPGMQCWAADEDVVITGSTADVPVLPAPHPYVSRVTVVMTPETATIPCGTFPYTFDVEFEIEVTGPVTVTFERMLSDGHTAPVETVVFAAYGTRTFDDYYRVGAAGTYWFRVHVITPNNISGDDTVTMTCSN